MFADRKRRKITVYNSDTGEKEIINPSEVRKISVLFKQSAKIYYEAGEDGDIGHYFTGRGTETYIQINERKDCLLIAYHESLGKKVNENIIGQERVSLRRYTAKHSEKYVGTIKQTDTVRLDDQNFTGNSDYVNFQVQIGGQRYEHQRRDNESTTVAHVLVTRPLKDSDGVYHYSSRKIAKVLLDSLNNGKTVKLLAENL
ncbi:unnamed protein product [Rotaria sp. Silwood1]|nr:unnamed protein product [Rotaria sp. Silwood1]CAF1635704.1 unnamed protein product [Rotaria sp. Silwood1]